MANPDYTEYRRFLEEFTATIDPTDQLPVRVSRYNLTKDEIPAEIINWSLQYLADKNCPSSLLNSIIRTVMEEIRLMCQKSPAVCGYDSENNIYQPLKLMHSVTARVNEICFRLLDNAQLDIILPPSTVTKSSPKYAALAIKNGRRKMEDRHVIIDDFNDLFGIKDTSRTGYYGLFDGHAGAEAAAYSVSHLHYQIALSPHYPNSPVDAIREAFIKTDAAFVNKSITESLQSGTTALCTLYRPDEKKMYVGWVGDSQALLVKNGKVYQIVTPHKADKMSEQQRIDKQGGSVMFYAGSWRVKGQLAITRAIGDANFKPYVTSEPEIVSVPLDGEEDFLIMASDGLWDHVTEDDAAITVYKQVRKCPENIDQVTRQLVDLAKTQGSTDNITIIVVFLKDPHLIATASWPSAVIPSPLDNMETAYNNSNGAFGNSNQDLFQKPQSLLHEFGLDVKASNIETGNVVETPSPSGDSLNNFAESVLNDNQIITTEPKTCDINLAFETNPKSPTSPSSEDLLTTETVAAVKPLNGKRGADSLEEEYDLGPETDVDTTDEAMLSPESYGAVKEQQHFEQKEIDVSEKIDNYNPFSNLDRIVEQEVPDVQQTLFEDAYFKHPQYPIEEHMDIEFQRHHIEQSQNNPFDDPSMYEENQEELPSDYIVETEDEKFCPDYMMEQDNKLVELLGGAAEKIESTFDNLKDFGDNIGSFIEKERTSFVDDFINKNIVEEGNVQQSEFQEEYEKEFINTENVAMDPEIIPPSTVESDIPSQEAQSDPTAAPVAEHVAESEDDSELEEWNYIKGDKETAEENKVKESHALSQGIAESQEACSELINDELTLDQELVDLEKKDEEEQKVEEEDEDMMASQLNPDAKEFVPSSPQRVTPLSPFAARDKNSLHISNLIGNDDVIAQSPRKGVAMDNIQLPNENDFDTEVSQRPHEIEDLVDKSPESPASYQEINLKEAMHGDEKKDECEDFSYNNYKNTEEAIVQQMEKMSFLGTMPEKIPDEQNPMNMSFHQDQLNDSFSTNPFDMNAVQMLPVSDDDENKENVEESNGHATENGVSTVEETLITEITETESHVEVADEISKPEEDMYSPVSDTKPDVLSDVEQNIITESEKPESELSHVETFIPTTETFEQETNAIEEPTIVGQETDYSLQTNTLFGIADIATDLDNMKINENIENLVGTTLSPLAMEFNPSFAAPSLEKEVADEQSTAAFLNSLPESEFHQQHSAEMKESPIEDSAESDNYLRQQEFETVTTEIVTSENIESYADEANKIGTPPPTPATKSSSINEEITESILSPEPEKLLEAVEKLDESIPELPEVPTDEPQAEIRDSPVEVVPAAIAATAVVAAGAIAAVAASKKASQQKPVDSKKEDLKAKPRTTKSTTATHVAATKTTATKTTAAKSSPLKSTTATTTAAPSRPKSVPLSSTVPKSPADKKPASTVTAAKRTTVPPVAAARTTPSKPTSAPKISSPGVKPAVSKTSTTTTSSRLSQIGTAKTTTTTTASSTVGGIKKTTTTTTTKTLSKPTVLAAKPKPTSTTATTTTTTSSSAAPKPRTPLSPVKAKTPIAATRSDKPASATKDVTATKPASTRPAPSTITKTTSASPKGTTTTTLRKTEATKHPISTRTVTKTTTTATKSNVLGAKKPLSSTTTTGRTTAITKKNIANKTNGETKTTTTTVTSITTEKLLNGDAIKKDITEVTELIDTNLIVSQQKNDDESLNKLTENSNQMIIDLTAD